MGGEIEFLKYVVFTASAITLVTDFFYRKIYNWLTLPIILLGVSTHTYLSGWSGLGDALSGVGIALLLFGWMFALRVMGAGDVKFLMAMGALGGARLVADTAFLSIMIGGAIALGILIFKGRIKVFLKKIYIFILSAFNKHLVLSFPEVDRKLTMPFGVAIALASIWVWVDNPMVRWGLRLW